jgi:hypothetical protein
MVFIHLNKENDLSNYWAPQNFDRYVVRYIAIDYILLLHHDGLKGVRWKSVIRPS